MLFSYFFLDLSISLRKLKPNLGSSKVWGIWDLAMFELYGKPKCPKVSKSRIDSVESPIGATVVQLSLGFATVVHQKSMKKSVESPFIYTCLQCYTIVAPQLHKGCPLVVQ